MANDVYDFNANYRGVKLVTARDMILQVNGATTTGSNAGSDYLVQNVAISYTQPIELIRELSTGNAYYHALPPQGVVSFGRIVGKRSIIAILGTPGQGIWTAPNNQDDDGGVSRTVTLKPVSGTTGGPRYTMHGCIVENFGNSLDANRSIITENVQIRFGRMELV